MDFKYLKDLKDFFNKHKIGVIGFIVLILLITFVALKSKIIRILLFLVILLLLLFLYWVYRRNITGIGAFFILSSLIGLIVSYFYTPLRNNSISIPLSIGFSSLIIAYIINKYLYNDPDIVSMNNALVFSIALSIFMYIITKRYESRDPHYDEASVTAPVPVYIYDEQNGNRYVGNVIDSSSIGITVSYDNDINITKKVIIKWFDLNRLGSTRLIKRDPNDLGRCNVLPPIPD